MTHCLFLLIPIETDENINNEFKLQAVVLQYILWLNTAIRLFFYRKAQDLEICSESEKVRIGMGLEFEVIRTGRKTHARACHCASESSSTVN